MTQKEQKALQYLERELAAYAEENITDGLEASYPGHNEIVRRCISIDPFYGKNGNEGSELVCFAMRAAGYSRRTISHIQHPDYIGANYLDKFEELLRQTETYKNIVNSR